MRQFRKQKLYLVVGDLFILAMLLIAATQVFAYGSYLARIPGRDYGFLALIPLLWAAIFFIQEGYECVFPREYLKGLRVLGQTAALVALIVGFLIFILPQTPEFSRRVLIVHSAVAIPALFAWRILFAFIARVPALRESVLVFGAGPMAQALAGLLLDEREARYALEGLVVLDGSASAGSMAPAIPFREVGEFIRVKRVQVIALAVTDSLPAAAVRFLTVARRRGIRVVRSQDFSEELTGRFPVGWVSPEEMVFFEMQSASLGRAVFERALSFTVAVLAFVASLPLWPFIIVAQQLTSPGPLFYVSMRVGRHGKPFRCLKFRSMVPDAERHTGVTWTAKNDPRVTKAGRWMRRTHIDELPQLVNVILGHMNLIGPRAERPELAQDLNEKIPFYEERFLVKPGITGWAQVNNVFTSASVEDSKEKLEYDLYYIKNRTFALDLLIVLETVKIMLLGRGV